MEGDIWFLDWCSFLVSIGFQSTDIVTYISVRKTVGLIFFFLKGSKCINIDQKPNISPCLTSSEVVMSYVWCQATLSIMASSQSFWQSQLRHINFLKCSFNCRNTLKVSFGLLNIFTENIYDLICWISKMQLRLFDWQATSPLIFQR